MNGTILCGLCHKPLQEGDSYTSINCVMYHSACYHGPAAEATPPESKATGFIFNQTKPGVWTVGFYNARGDWRADSDWKSRGEAASWCHYLNGGPDADLLAACHKARALAGTIEFGKPPREMAAEVIEVLAAAIARAEGRA